MELDCNWKKGERLTSAVSRAIKGAEILSGEPPLVVLVERVLCVKTKSMNFQAEVPSELFVWGKREKRKEFLLELRPC